jgi:hypothetical protein
LTHPKSQHSTLSFVHSQQFIVNKWQFCLFRLSLKLAFPVQFRWDRLRDFSMTLFSQILWLFYE